MLPSQLGCRCCRGMLSMTQASGFGLLEHNIHSAISSIVLGVYCEPWLGHAYLEPWLRRCRRRTTSCAFSAARKWHLDSVPQVKASTGILWSLACGGIMGPSGLAPPSREPAIAVRTRAGDGRAVLHAKPCCVSGHALAQRAEGLRSCQGS